MRIRGFEINDTYSFSGLVLPSLSSRRGQGVVIAIEGELWCFRQAARLQVRYKRFHILSMLYPCLCYAFAMYKPQK
jgi:hypothetical protein